MARVTTVPSMAVFRYCAFTCSGTWLSCVSKKRVPMAMPLAPLAMADTRPRPSLKPPAPKKGNDTTSATCRMRMCVGTLPV
jgi:hypothetical protein